MKIPKVEIPKSGFAQRIINNLIWGKSYFNPNNVEKKITDKELLDEANRLIQNDKAND